MNMYIFNKDRRVPSEMMDSRFTYQVMRWGKLSPCEIFMYDETKYFIPFAEWFCQNAAWLSAFNYTTNEPYSDYRSDDGRFTVRYMPYFMDKNKYGNMVEIPSPARVGHDSGRIEISQKYFLQHTIPVRMLWMLHEHSHFFINPKLKREKGDELSANINALYIYLGLMFPRIDAREGFIHIFKNNPTHENLEVNYPKIVQFIEDFDNGKVDAAICRKT